MKLAIALSLGLVALAFTVPVAAAEPGPCPGGGYSCSPPILCGWAPDVKKDPVGYAEFWVECLADRTVLP
jgi:hypothetical protein